MWLAIKNELGISDRYFGTIPISLRTTGGDNEVTIDADAEPPGFLESYIEQTKAYDCPKSPTNQHEYAVGSGICVFCERKFTKD